MAKRRNAPALFELLRDSNSTRSGQIGGEQLRAQIGGGVVPNAVPKPPNHPSLKTPPPETTGEKTPEQPAGLSVPVAGQVASEAVVESKEVAPTVPPPAALDAPEAAPLAAMPSFRAGRSVAPKPEAKPESRPETKPEPVVVKIVPPEVPKPEPKPAQPAPVDKAEPKIEREPFAEPAPTPEKVSEAEGAVLEPEDGADEGEALPLIRRQGNQLTVSTFAVGTAATACLLLLLVAYLVGTAVGNSQGKSELEPMVRDQADTALQTPDGQGIPSIGTSPAGRDDRPIDPVRLTPDPQERRPVAAVPTEETKPEVAKPEARGPETVQITNEDTRIPGQNYLHLAVLADGEEARRLQAYFAEHGIATHIREQFRGGRQGHEIITLVGIASEEWSTSTRKIEHEREVKRLGGLWFRDFGGSIDFSRDNQSVWYKAKADGS